MSAQQVALPGGMAFEPGVPESYPHNAMDFPWEVAMFDGAASRIPTWGLRFTKPLLLALS